MIDAKTYIKQLQIIQNMTDTQGVKELCELIMELLADLEKNEKPLGFQARKDDK